MEFIVFSSLSKFVCFYSLGLLVGNGILEISRLLNLPVWSVKKRPNLVSPFSVMVS